MLNNLKASTTYLDSLQVSTVTRGKYESKSL